MSAEVTRWLTAPLAPSMSRTAMSVEMSPATLIVSLPSPPITRYETPNAVDWTKNWSSPSSPSISIASTVA